MPLRQARSLFPLVLLGLWAAPACGGNDSSGGPPAAPCTEEVKGSAPFCGSACTVRCGCKTCADGEQRVVSGTLYICASGCFASESGSGGAPSGGGGSPSGGGGGASGSGGTPSGGGTTSTGGAGGSGGVGLVGGNAGAGGT